MDGGINSRKLRHVTSPCRRAATELSESIGIRFVSGADGIGDTEGEAATGSGERAGRQASFKFVSRLYSQKFKKSLPFIHASNKRKLIFNIPSGLVSAMTKW